MAKLGGIRRGGLGVAELGGIRRGWVGVAELGPANVQTISPPPPDLHVCGARAGKGANDRGRFARLARLRVATGALAANPQPGSWPRSRNPGPGREFATRLAAAGRNPSPSRETAAAAEPAILEPNRN